MPKPLASEDIVLLLEGDVSDIEDDDDDDFSKDVLEEAFTSSIGVSVSDEGGAVCKTLDLDHHIVPLEVHGRNEDDEVSDVDEDDMPLSLRLERLNQDKTPEHVTRNQRWRHKNMEAVDVSYNVAFTDPPIEDLSPLNYFEKFIDDNIVENFVEQTNLYSTQKTGKSINTSVIEMCQFIGIHILAGIVRMPKYRMYWANSTRYQPIAETMSRDRFGKLRKFMHVNNNDKMVPREHNDYDKLFKIRPFIESLRKNFLKIEPEEHNSVDEMMIPMKSHTSMLQYIKNKPHRWGVKVFARAGVSGIVYDFEIYVGKGTKVKDGHLGMSGNVVIRLVQDLPKHKNHKLFIDNWFSSYDVAVELKKMGIHMVGTVRRNRLAGCTLQTDMSLKKSGRGSYDFRVETNENIILCKWFDNKAVHLISTYISQEPVEFVKRWSVATKQYVNVPRPSIVKEYNTFMGGVDLHDMLVQLYRTNIKGQRFYLRIIFHFINMACVNAWLLYRRHCAQQNKKHRPLLDFVCDIAAGLLKRGAEPRKRGRQSESPKPGPSKKRRVEKAPRPVADVRYDGVGHWPEYYPNKSRCKLCIKSYSRMKCGKCNVSLCLNKEKNCFLKFHVM